MVIWYFEEVCVWYIEEVGVVKRRHCGALSERMESKQILIVLLLVIAVIDVLFIYHSGI